MGAGPAIYATEAACNAAGRKRIAESKAQEAKEAKIDQEKYPGVDVGDAGTGTITDFECRGRDDSKPR